MNNERRERLNEIRTKLEELSAELERVESEEQDAFDNMPENLRDGEKGQAMEQNIDAINEAKSTIDDAVSSLESIE